jgi:hypothetical protein
MKRALLTLMVMLCALLGFSQLQEDFDPAPSGWLLSQGANFQSVNSNGVIVTPGVGGNNPANIGTPAVNKTSNTFEVCFNAYAYTSNLNSQTPFPCNTYVDVLFVKSTVTSSSDASLPENILARVDNHLLPAAGGNTCFSFTFPATVTDPTFKVFLSFHADCGQGGIKYVIDQVTISGVNLICGGVNCAPGVSNDVFNRPAELSFNAVLYGAPIDASYPAPGAGYAVDAGGTDGDQNDSYTHLKWQLLTTPVNGTVTVNADGTATISRNSWSVTTLTFTYMLCDDGPDNNILTTGDNMCSNPATVTVNFPAGNPLPVSLISFTAARSGGKVSLRWETATESGNTGFEVLRSNGSGDFQKVGFVNTKAIGGNSSTKLTYEFTDVSTVKGLSLYKLRQVDQDGKSQYSQVRSVKGEESKSSITVYPTPSTTGNVSIAVSGLQAFDMQIVDMTGRVIRQYKQATNGHVKIENLQNGMYMVKVTDLASNEQTSEKIVVSKR